MYLVHYITYTTRQIVFVYITNGIKIVANSHFGNVKHRVVIQTWYICTGLGSICGTLITTHLKKRTTLCTKGSVNQAGAVQHLIVCSSLTISTSPHIALPSSHLLHFHHILLDLIKSVTTTLIVFIYNSTHTCMFKSSPMKYITINIMMFPWRY